MVAARGRDDALRSAAEMLRGAHSLVVLTGAGVSAESGIATFRDAQTGLWSRYDPAALATPEGFAADPGLVWRWYMSRLAGVRQAQPNPGHRALARLEARLNGPEGHESLHAAAPEAAPPEDCPGLAGHSRPGPHSVPPGETSLRTVVRSRERFALFTQNVDDLHERAGSAAVFHLHGTIARFRCNHCRAPHALREEERAAPGPPACAQCGDLVRPDVVWFGEDLPAGLLARAQQAAEECDVMLVVGTSGQVYPVAMLPTLAKSAGATLIDVNPEPGPITALADVFLQGPSAVVLPDLLALLESPIG